MYNANILYGTTSDMEYSLDGGATWTTCTTNTDLSAIDLSNVAGIEVRYKSTTLTLPGQIFTISLRPVMGKLSTPQIIDIVRIYHPDVQYTMVAKLLSMAQVKFLRASKLNLKRSILNVTAQTVVGKTQASPLAITDTASAYIWDFYKDGTVPSVTLDTNVNVMFFTNLMTLDTQGNEINSYSIIVNEDASITFYDAYDTTISDFDKTVGYMYIDFMKMPADLTVSQNSLSELQSEYQEALAHYVIAELYPARSDMQVIERLQLAKHFRNLYDEAEKKAEFAHHMGFRHEMPITVPTGSDFHQ